MTSTAEPDVGPESVTPAMECDVVMKGGITSGVVYPMALSEIGATYRFRGIGGTSAGAIGAAVGAAAELGRDSGGFARMEALPAQLGGGALAAMFQPQKKTRPMLRLMLAASGTHRSGTSRQGWRKYVAATVGLFLAFPLAILLGLIPGVALVVYGVTTGGWPGGMLIAAGAVLLGVGWLTAVVLSLVRQFTVHVPANLFGICRGLRNEGSSNPGFTEWLSTMIDDVAGLPPEARPLRFGQLWTRSLDVADVDEADRDIDLRMISTCLSQGRPYELPWDGRKFFYDPRTWETLFPAEVMQSLLAAPQPEAPPEQDQALSEWRWEEQLAAANSPPLRRLPGPEQLPVIVATRLSLSFPLLISAVPLWTINRRSQQTQQTSKAFREALKNDTEPPSNGLEFTQLWFTDGGLCSNFPVHLFDAALARRPTFAINLGPFSSEQSVSDDQSENVEYTRSNSHRLLPPHFPIADSGFGAVAGFASAAINTARTWQDSSQLDQPGFRDRIVRVMHTKHEGGMNLHMDSTTINGLADRGRVAGHVMVAQFTQPRYPLSNPTASGWDNHRWVRYRALLSTLPAWLMSYSRGRGALNIDPADPPGYRLTKQGQQLAADLTEALDKAVDVIAAADEDALAELTDAPRPQGLIRRIPQT